MRLRSLLHTIIRHGLPCFSVLMVLVALTLSGGHSLAAVTLQAATPTPDLDWQLTVKHIDLQSKTPDFTVTISQPVLQSTGASSGGKADAFNTAVDAFVASAQADLKSGLTDTTGAPPGSSSSLHIDYNVLASNKGFISVQFLIDQFIAGAAHPLHNIYSINYNLHTGKVLTLADLFKPKADYLTPIAKFVSAELKRENRLSFPDGTLPKAENYGVWNMTHGGLLFSFTDYQVGPYAQGESVVFVPYSALGDIFNDDYFFAV